eukprot:CFRG3838T1
MLGDNMVDETYGTVVVPARSDPAEMFDVEAFMMRVDELPEDHRKWTTDQRQDWIRYMRIHMCHKRVPHILEEEQIVTTEAKDDGTVNIIEQTLKKASEKMCHEDGTFNKKYFETEVTEVEERVWTEKEKALLLKGIELHGIGKFGDISAEMLPSWTANELRVKTMHLIGRQNLQLYKGFKGDAAEIQKQYERNRKIGLATGCWKAGTLVTDDDGVVQRMIDETEAEQTYSLQK